jgi:hypothetical protein
MTDYSSSAAQSHCPSIAPALPEIGSNCHAPALTLSPDEYLHFLAESDWSESQKREFIEALWSIVVSFVDMGFHIHPLQHGEENQQTLEVESAGVLASNGISDSTNLGAASYAKARAREEEES